MEETRKERSDRGRMAQEKEASVPSFQRASNRDNMPSSPPSSYHFPISCYLCSVFCRPEDHGEGDRALASAWLESHPFECARRPPPLNRVGDPGLKRYFSSHPDHLFSVACFVPQAETVVRWSDRVPAYFATHHGWCVFSTSSL